jgi:hypothetical protein
MMKLAWVRVVVLNPVRVAKTSVPLRMLFPWKVNSPNVRPQIDRCDRLDLN